MKPNYALQDSESLNVSRVATADRVHGNLWVGDMPIPFSDLSEGFDCLVLCAMEYQVPDLFPGVEVILAPMNDDGSPMLRREAETAVRAAGAVINRLARGERVLSTCMAGRNRSGLVACIVLCKGFGMSPDEAVRAVRAARGPGAFRNSDFESFLRSFIGRRGWVSSRAAR